MQIGIIGAGVAGLTAAWLLDHDHAVTLFEKQSRLGGHSDTIQVEREGETIGIEAGFEFFSESMYPNFYRLLTLLHVPVHKFPLTATFYRTDPCAITMLPPYRNGRVIWPACRPRALAEMVQLARVLRLATPLMNAADTSITLSQFLDGIALSAAVKERFIYPFLLAGWCVELEEFKQFIAYDVLRYPFLHQPAGLKLAQWLEVAGGTQAYVNSMARELSGTRSMTAAGIAGITRANGGLAVRMADGSTHQFDQLIVATNASEARELLAQLDGAEVAREILSAFEYFPTTIAVHGDRRLMPANEQHWSVANVRYDGRHSQNTIWKGWKSKRPVFKSWVTYDTRMPEPLYASVNYQHPKVNAQYFRAQPRLAALQGNEGLWFAGMYTCGVDSHESAILSSMAVAQKLAPRSARLKQLAGAMVDANGPRPV